MLQNGSSPSLAMPPENVTACPSAMPTSKARSGMASINMFMEHPLGMAGVTPTMRSFCLASSMSVSPKTFWYRGGSPSVLSTSRLPVLGSKRPGACQMVASSSAGANPRPFTVWMWSSFGPFISFSVRRVRTSSMTLCPSTGPK